MSGQSQFFEQRFGEPKHRPFARRVRRGERQRQQSRRTGDIDDVCFGTSEQLWQQRVRDGHRAEAVDLVDHPMPFERQVLECPAANDAGVVDEDVDRAMLRENVIVNVLHARRVGHVHRVAECAVVGFCQQADGLVNSVCVAIGDDDFAAGFGERLGQLTTEAVAGAGDQNSLVLEVRHGGALWSAAYQRRKSDYLKSDTSAEYDSSATWRRFGWWYKLNKFQAIGSA